MSKSADIPWKKIYNYVLACGQEHDPYRFVVTALEKIDTLIPYDEGLAYCLDENRRVCEQHLRNIRSRWSNMYIEYYSQQKNDAFNLYSNPANELAGKPLITPINWDEQPTSEFMRNYIMARGVHYSLAFAFFDQSGSPRVAASLDRTSERPFSESEVEILELVAAQLANLYKNFFTDPATIPGVSRNVDDATLDALLTKREREVVKLLCQGLSPATISTTLNISLSTAYKHIAHIYKKLHVSSQQELLVRVLRAR